MAVKQEMTVTIDADGSVAISVAGVKGKSCVDLTTWLEEELGVVTSRTNTSEYYQSEVKQTEKLKVGR